MEKKIKDYVKIKTDTIDKILNTQNKYKITFLDNNLMGIMDNSNNKLIIAGNYNFYGIYQTNTKLWIWATSIPGVSIDHFKNIKKIKKNNYLFENNKDEKSNFYYQLLTQDVLLINDIQMLEWINNLLLYLSNDKFYFNPTNSDLNMQFLTLSNIIEKYI
jgi:hypothetical protein